MLPPFDRLPLQVTRVDLKYCTYDVLPDDTREKELLDVDHHMLRGRFASDDKVLYREDPAGEWYAVFP